MEKGDDVRVACSWLCCHWTGVCSGLLTLFPCLLLVHAAVLAINEAVERGVVKDTLAALQNPSALLENLREPLAAIYQELLAQAKMEKTANARNHVRNLGGQRPKSWVARKNLECPVSGFQSCLEKL